MDIDIDTANNIKSDSRYTAYATEDFYIVSNPISAEGDGSYVYFQLYMVNWFDHD